MFYLFALRLASLWCGVSGAYWLLQLSVDGMRMLNVHRMCHATDHQHLGRTLIALELIASIVADTFRRKVIHILVLVQHYLSRAESIG